MELFFWLKVCALSDFQGSMRVILYRTHTSMDGFLRKKSERMMLVCCLFDDSFDILYESAWRPAHVILHHSLGRINTYKINMISFCFN